MDPLRGLGRKTSGWNHAVEVGMMEQVLPPGMQDSKESNLCSKVARVLGYLLQGLRTGAEQEVIEDLLVL